MCIVSLTSVMRPDAAAVNDINACVSFPCKNGTQNGVATCRDLPPPAGNTTSGRNCSCNANFTYNEANGCLGMAMPGVVPQVVDLAPGRRVL
jgi:hypothetical protein